MEIVNASSWAALLINVIILIFLFRELYKVRHSRKPKPSPSTDSDIVQLADAWRERDHDNRAVIMYFVEKCGNNRSVTEIVSGFSHEILYALCRHMDEDKEIAKLYHDAVRIYDECKAEQEEKSDEDGPED